MCLNFEKLRPVEISRGFIDDLQLMMGVEVLYHDYYWHRGVVSEIFTDHVEILIRPQPLPLLEKFTVTKKSGRLAPLFTFTYQKKNRNFKVPGLPVTYV